jgi:hypothetical protein
MKKQFVIYDFSSNSFFVSLNEQEIVWGSSPMLFDSKEEAETSLSDAYGMFPIDFNGRLISITDVLISEQMILNKNK